MADRSQSGRHLRSHGSYVYVNQTLVRKQIAARQHDRDVSPPLELVIVTLDGVPREVEALAITTQREGRIAHKVVFRNLSAQKATEAKPRFQAALVDHVSDAIISTTTSGYVTSWNPAAEAPYQCPAVDALGMPVGGVVGTELDLAGIVAFGGVVHTTHRANDGSVWRYGPRCRG